MSENPRALAPPPWLWINILSLDAPLVAVVWQALLAQSFMLPLRPAARLVLGLTVWAIYLADRILDVRTPPAGPESARHQFYRRHPWLAAGLLLLVLALDFLVILSELSPQVVRHGLIASLGVGFYLLVFHARRLALPIPKELAVALLFTAGTFVVAATWAPSPTVILLAPAASFFLLCAANLIAIECWEWRELRVEPAPHPLVRALGQAYLLWVPALALLSLAEPRSWYTAVAVSAVTLSVIHALRGQAPLELRRTLVDAALLSPLLFLR